MSKSTPVLTVGAVPVHRVEELRIPNTIAHFTDDQDLIAAHRAWLHPHFLDDANRFDLVFQSWIFEVDGRVVLVDPCTGNGKPHPVPFFDMLDVPFIERMAETGYRPQDIDFVVCTHLHHDHCGWNTQLRDGQWVPTFPNARYVMQQAEVDRWGAHRAQHPQIAYNDLVFERSVQPILAAGLADLVDGDRDLAPGLAVEAAPGHTLGHQILHLASNGARACFTGDCFHHPIQLAEPSLHFGDTEDKQAIEAIRTRLIEHAIAHQALLIPAHLPAPYAVRAWRKHGTVRFAAA